MTLRVDRIERTDGNNGFDVEIVQSGCAKSWMNYSQISGVVADSHNFSSITDHGQAHFSHNLSNVMQNGSYCLHVTWCYGDADTASGAFYYNYAPGQRLACTPGYSRINQFGSTDNGTSSDNLVTCISHHGGLA